MVARSCTRDSAKSRNLWQDTRLETNRFYPVDQLLIQSLDQVGNKFRVVLLDQMVNRLLLDAHVREVGAHMFPVLLPFFPL